MTVEEYKMLRKTCQDQIDAFLDGDSWVRNENGPSVVEALNIFNGEHAHEESTQIGVEATFNGMVLMISMLEHLLVEKTIEANRAGGFAV